MTSYLLRGLVFFIFLNVASAAGKLQIPEPNPPVVQGQTPKLQQSRQVAGVAGPTVPSCEWTFHKTADGSHPNDSEQQMVWLMNRARCRPCIEGIWLAHLRQWNVQYAMDCFNVQRDILMNEFAVRSNMPPAAFDVRLYNAASNHSAYLISINDQNHSNQTQRIKDQGFHYLTASVCVYSYAEDPIYAHAGFNVDWGGTNGTGMQTDRGHREALMGDLSSVGIACVPEDDTNTLVGPLVISSDYCNALTSYTNHYNRFIVGTVWDDLNTNNLYDPGEGIGSVTVMPDKGTFYAVTGNAGGYAIPVDPDTYVLTFTGAGLPSNYVKTVTVYTNSVLVDCPVHNNPIEVQTTLTQGTNHTYTYTLAQQRKGCVYRISTCTNLLSGNWTCAGVLPSGYGDTLTYNVQLIDTNAPQRFISLQGWQY